MRGCVKVYEVTTTSSRLAYTLTSQEWEGKDTRDTAVSESLPGSMLVICQFQPYVYQFPCHEATQEVKKYRIKSDEEKLWCIVANASSVVIKMSGQSSFTVCSLPDFTHQSHVQTNFKPCDLSISPDYLLVMGGKEMVVRSVAGDMSEDLCEIKLPDGCRVFRSVCFGVTAAREMYVVCKLDEKKFGVFKYTWDESGKPVFVNTGCVIDGLGWVYFRCLSVTSDGLMAIGGNEVMLYNFE